MSDRYSVRRTSCTRRRTADRAGDAAMRLTTARATGTARTVASVGVGASVAMPRRRASAAMDRRGERVDDRQRREHGQEDRHDDRERIDLPEVGELRREDGRLDGRAAIDDLGRGGDRVDAARPVEEHQPEVLPAAAGDEVPETGPGEEREVVVGGGVGVGQGGVDERGEDRRARRSGAAGARCPPVPRRPPCRRCRPRGDRASPRRRAPRRASPEPVRTTRSRSGRRRDRSRSSGRRRRRTGSARRRAPRRPRRRDPPRGRRSPSPGRRPSTGTGPQRPTTSRTPWAR